MQLGVRCGSAAANLHTAIDGLEHIVCMCYLVKEKKRGVIGSAGNDMGKCWFCSPFSGAEETGEVKNGCTWVALRTIAHEVQKLGQ